MIDWKITDEEMSRQFFEIIRKIRPAISNQYDSRAVYAAFSILAESYKELLRSYVKGDKTTFDNLMSTVDILSKNLVTSGLRPILEDSDG